MIENGLINEVKVLKKEKIKCIKYDWLQEIFNYLKGNAVLKKQ